MNLHKIKYDNNIKISNRIHEFNSPEKIYIPIYENVTLRGDDYIYKNQIIGGSISSISGKIIDSKKVKINNKTITSLEVINDYKENSRKGKSKKDINNKKELLNILDDYLLYNIKKKLLNEGKYLVISGIDIDDYSITNEVILTKYYEEILDTIDKICNILSLDRAYIATKNTSFSNIKSVKSRLGTYPKVNLILVPDLYLIYKKEFLCEYLNINKDDSIYLTIKDIYNIYSILEERKSITENIITISGNAINKSIIVKARLYTSLEEIINEYLKIKEEDYEIFINGLLLDKKVELNNTIITNDIDTIIINKRIIREKDRCINCGACERICPYHINVKKCYYNNSKNVKCINCGLCTYICPANINLHSIVGGNNEKK